MSLITQMIRRFYVDTTTPIGAGGRVIRTETKPTHPAQTQWVHVQPEPLYLLKAAHTIRHLRELCETQSPEPLRRHTLYASPNYLEMA